MSSPLLGEAQTDYVCVGKFFGYPIFTERSEQTVPLQNWSGRICPGAGRVLAREDQLHAARGVFVITVLAGARCFPCLIPGRR